MGTYGCLASCDGAVDVGFEVAGGVLVWLLAVFGNEVLTLR